MKPWALIFFSLFSFLLIFNLSRQLLEWPKAEGRFKALQQKVADLKLTNWQLKQEKQARESNDFLETEIRDKLLMSKKGELVVVLPEAVKDQFASAAATPLEEEKPELAPWRQWWSLFFPL